MVLRCVDHCVQDIVGWHVTKIGDPFAALEPVRQGVNRHFAQIGVDVARGLAFRHDHGSQYMSRDFLGEVRFLGIRSPPTFVGEPQGNRIAERFMPPCANSACIDSVSTTWPKPGR